MNSTPPLTRSELRSYETIFQHPFTSELEWRDLRALLDRLCDVSEEPNGNLILKRNGQTLVVHPPRAKNFSTTDQIVEIRDFLERTEKAQPETGENEAHWLVVIDHHEARIFRSEMRGSVPQQILPHEPSYSFRHAHHSMDFSRGQEKPDLNSFFEPVAKALTGAGKILIFGTGTGTSSEMDQFTTWSKHHHPELAQRITGTLVIDEHHMTDAQLLALAREYYANVGKS